ncbi:hypothetical protein DUI87_11814 [Hirundo rustica rustica]|uniref:C-type lectin domain-containing protein n=1 Tax=Hirundo rustica rustica TaxID=333673 RepID=A0A3M0KEU2_HIRRU|nr:hypothetical protein DUI87_11814 [Hirundo rustica rustica]
MTKLGNYSKTIQNFKSGFEIKRMDDRKRSRLLEEEKLNTGVPHSQYPRFFPRSISDQERISCLVCARDQKLMETLSILAHSQKIILSSQSILSGVGKVSYRIMTCRKETAFGKGNISQNSTFLIKAALALNGKIRKVGEKILASNGKKVDFVSALKSCEEAGGTLAAPKNEEENKAIMDIVKQYNQYAYLGIRKGEASDAPLSFDFAATVVRFCLVISVIITVLRLNKIITESGGKIFATNGKRADFDATVEKCKEAGGSIATPRNPGENDAILYFVKYFNTYAYLGIKQSLIPGKFQPLNGGQLSYTNWYSNEPSGRGEEECVEMYTDGTWNDKKCNKNHLIVCQF